MSGLLHHTVCQTISEQVNMYLKGTDTGKAFQVGKSLVVSGHIKNVITHLIQ